MKLTRDNIFRILPFITALIAVILFCISAIEERTEGKTEHVAASAGKKVEKRIAVLEITSEWTAMTLMDIRVWRTFRRIWSYINM